MNMTEFRYFEYRNLAPSGLNRFYLITLKNKWISEQTNPVLVTLVQGSISIESMSEIDFLAVSVILMIISEFDWHWLTTWTIENFLVQEFGGNQSSLVLHWLKPHIHARFVRFVPLTWVGQRCMRVGLYGCKKLNASFEELSGNLKNGKA